MEKHLLHTPEEAPRPTPAQAMPAYETESVPSAQKYEEEMKNVCRYPQAASRPQPGSPGATLYLSAEHVQRRRPQFQ